MSRTPTTPALKERAERLAVSLVQARDRSGLTQVELADRSGVNIDTVRALERHRSGNPGVFFIVDIAQALGVAVEDLTS